MKRLLSLLAMFLLALSAVAQHPPIVKFPPSPLPNLFPETPETLSATGMVVAYDWSTRYYMEGARVERFVFRADSASIRATTTPRLFRAVLLWHPADRPRILPTAFYAADKRWKLTLSTSSPFDFVRGYCALDTATFNVEVDGRTVALPRYVNPTVLPPNTDLATNFTTAISRQPVSADIPDPQTLPCLYLRKVTPAP